MVSLRNLLSLLPVQGTTRHARCLVARDPLQTYFRHNPFLKARIMNDRESARGRIARVAWLLDNSIPLPGVRFRIGIDAILGLIPGIGDVLGVLLSSYIVREAARAGAPPSVLARMTFNVAVEGIVGMVPFLGDIFDAAWKANQRNLALFDAHLANPQRTRRSSRVFVGLMIVVLVAFLALMGAVSFFVMRAVWQAVT